MMEHLFDRWHARAREIPALYRLALVSRISLAFAFLPTGLVKVLGERFTSISVENPIGFFFEALYQSGVYWNFIGLAQVIAGVLVLIPRTATLGAVVAFPIVLNIFIITVSLHFTGTPFITGGLLLAALFLLCWDYDRFKPIVFAGQSAPARAPVPLGRLERVGFAIGTAAGLGLLGWTRGLIPSAALPALLAVGAGAALLVLVAWIRLAIPSRAPRAA
jgi:uncharacterized membrane protein YphA (DoxX/SURF4 family)